MRKGRMALRSEGSVRSSAAGGAGRREWCPRAGCLAQSRLRLSATVVPLRQQEGSRSGYGHGPPRRDDHDRWRANARPVRRAAPPGRARARDQCPRSAKASRGPARSRRPLSRFRPRSEPDARADCFARSGPGAGPSKAVSCAGHRRKGSNHLTNMPCAPTVTHGFPGPEVSICHAGDLAPLTFP